MRQKVSSWGRLLQSEHEVCVLDKNQPIAMQVHPPGLPYGKGCSYGDVCLNPGGVLWDTTTLDRFIDFDASTGRLRCQAGVLLQDIQRLFIPRGYSLPVTPGTQRITVGGAIANDVHGKNHYQEGSFAHHVQALTLVRTDGQVVTCSLTQDQGLFCATLGGLGLTGVIAQADIQLKRTPGPWLRVETQLFASLDVLFSLIQTSLTHWEHTVAWLDGTTQPCHRGLFSRANSIESQIPWYPSQRSYSIPDLPFSVINKMMLKPFNSLYRHRKKQHPERLDVESFLYPLDTINHWNRLYGPKGFFQYQCVVPFDKAQDTLAGLLDDMQRLGEIPSLAVLKTFGPRDSLGMLSFPQPGMTFAFDFPNHKEATLTLFALFDQRVAEAGGRLYLAKDARMSSHFFAASYPRWSEFMTYRDKGIGSALSRRLMGY